MVRSCRFLVFLWTLLCFFLFIGVCRHVAKKRERGSGECALEERKVGQYRDRGWRFFLRLGAHAREQTFDCLFSLVLRFSSFPVLVLYMVNGHPLSEERDCMTAIERDTQADGPWQNLLESVEEGQPCVLAESSLRCLRSAQLQELLSVAPRDSSGRPILYQADFRETIFQDGAVFRLAGESAPGGTMGTVFAGGAQFGGAVFAGDAWFGGAVFDGTAWFGRSLFKRSAGFGNAVFEDSSWFAEAEFCGGAWFTDATFKRSACFGGALFFGNTWFDRVSFEEELWSGKAVFAKDSCFGEAVFHGKTSFVEATFQQRAVFDKATFSENTCFSRSNFARGAAFERTVFTKGVLFDRTLFYGGTGLEDAVFRGRPQFTGTVFRAPFAVYLVTPELDTASQKTVPGTGPGEAGLKEKAMSRRPVAPNLFDHTSVWRVEELLPRLMKKFGIPASQERVESGFRKIWGEVETRGDETFFSYGGPGSFEYGAVARELLAMFEARKAEGFFLFGRVLLARLTGSDGRSLVFRQILSERDMQELREIPGKAIDRLAWDFAQSRPRLLSAAEHANLTAGSGTSSPEKSGPPGNANRAPERALPEQGPPAGKRAASRTTTPEGVVPVARVRGVPKHDQNPARRPRVS